MENKYEKYLIENKYCDKDNLWKVYALFRDEYLDEMLLKFDNKISDIFLETIYYAKWKFYTNKNKTILYGYFSQMNGECDEIDGCTALKLYGVSALEDATEKSETRI